jgi:hypothetical protein
MKAAELRAEISAEARALGGLNTLLSALAEGAPDASIGGSVGSQRDLYLTLAEMVRESYYRLCRLAEEPQRPTTPPRPRKRQPTLQVVTKSEAA